MSTKTQAKPLFAATLTPHRSLSPQGKRIVIALVAALALVPGFVFYAAGAWPVVGFMGLDVLAIWLALTISMRSGRAQEVVSLWPGMLEVTKTDPKGRETVLQFEPFAVRFVIDRDYNERVTGLWLRQRDDRVPLGAFLSAEEKLSFSKAFGAALRQARHGA
ncbi:MAG: DUF2244 domain-containing protein [Devosia sp.]